MRPMSSRGRQPCFRFLVLLIYYYWYPIMNCNAFCGYQSIPFHCFLQSGAELESGEIDGRGRGWVGLYSSIKTTVKVVVTTEHRGDSSDQELLVSSTLLSTEDRARVYSCYAPVHEPTCSVPVPEHSCSCCWQSGLIPVAVQPWWRWFVSAAVMKILPAVTTPLPQDGKETHCENCISTWLTLADFITIHAVCI